MATIGAPLNQDLERSEDDTDDVVLHFTNADGTDADITGWTALLSVGPDADSLGAGYQTTYPGTGSAGGLMSIDMDLFDVPIGTYKYDIRVTDTVTGDTPARVYVKGKLKVTSRIN